MNSCLRWVVALKAEATPLIEKFRLHHIGESSDLFPIYRSRDSCVDLVISGPGKVSAAAATSFLAARGNADSISGWINFGIAGSGSDDYGTTYLASKIRDRSTGQAWYPSSAADKKEPPRRGVETIDRPSDHYPEDGTLIEMEASGFCPVALRASSAELCQVVKVVSDGPAHPIEAISKTQVRDLCGTALDRIGPWLDTFRELIDQEAVRFADPPGFKEWTAKLRFSETQRHRLRRLLRQWDSVNDGGIFPPQFTDHEAKSPQRLLDTLEMKLRAVTAPGI